MKILHFSALDGQTGAGIAAARIHEALLARGVESRFCVAHPTRALQNAFTPRVTLAGRAVRKLQRAVDERMLRPATKHDDYVLSTGAFGFDVGRIVRQERPDIVQLHWIGGNSFRLKSLSGIRVPVVWRCPDQWAFCGLQHYEPDPQTYCPAPPRRSGWIGAWTNLSEHVRSRKAAVYRTIDQLVLVCPSRWLAAETRRSALLGNRPIEIIPTSCDTALFSPKDRYACRAALGLSRDRHVVLVGATSMGTRWKGFDLFVAAMAQFLAQWPKDARRIEIVTFGQDVCDTPGLKPTAEVRHFGPVRDRRLMSILYNAADVFAAPSRMENLANTVLESLSCGTPAVAFATGGMPDMIDHEVNGILAAPFDTAEFAAGIRWALTHSGRDRTRAACRDKVLARFSIAEEADAYLALYGRLTGKQLEAAGRHVTVTAAEQYMAS